ncbi:MAG: hypothetical protein P8Y68_18245 [Anaerolineales bacterium]|jgi:hypothetical protein
MSVLSTNISPRKVLLGLLIFALGILLTFFIIKFSINDVPIWFFGKDVIGVVDEKWYELISEEGASELEFEYFVRYHFVSSDGEVFTGSASLSALDWSGLVEGRDVSIVYSPLDPANNRIDDSRYVPLLLCSYIPIIIIAYFFVTQGWNLLFRELKQEKIPHWSAKREEKTNSG